MSLQQYAESHGLKRVGQRPPFVSYVKEAWQRRDFAWTMANFANQSANARNRLGRWWLLLTPAIQGATYGLIFGFILGSDNRPENYIAFLFIGVFLFGFMSGSVTSGATAVTGNAGLVKSLSFPRVLLPVSTTIQQLIGLLPQLALMVLTVLVTGNPVAWKFLLLIPAVILLILFAAGMAMFASRVTVQFGDITKLIPFALRVLFYTSGIFFSLEKVLKDVPYGFAVAQVNPFYAFIHLVRGILLPNAEYALTSTSWIICGAWALFLPLLGVIFFWKAEERYGRED